jgi:hypothetical protein
MSRFDERIAVGLDRITAYAAVMVTLRRGASQTLDVPAIVGVTRSQRTTDSDGATGARSRQRDYLINAFAYVIDGVPVEPRAGDEIDQSLNGDTARFEVQPLAGTDVAWSWSDGNRKRYRLHTREIDARE